MAMYVNKDYFKNPNSHLSCIVEAFIRNPRFSQSPIDKHPNIGLPLDGRHRFYTSTSHRSNPQKCL